MHQKGSHRRFECGANYVFRAIASRFVDRSLQDSKGSSIVGFFCCVIGLGVDFRL